MSVPDAPVTFVVPGDLHLTEPNLDNHRAALRMVEAVNGLIRPDFVQFIGDNVQDATETQFRLFDDLRGRLDVPHFALVGDHDVKDDPAAIGFRRSVGPTFGSTSLRGVRFVRLCTQEAKPLGISAEQVAWFRAQVDEARAGGESVVVFQHNYPYQIWEDFAGPGIDAWREIVQTRHVAALVCGHTHYFQVANDGRNVAVAVRSIGDPEGGPPGYLIGVVHGDDVALTYRPVDDPGPIALITHPTEALMATGPRHVVRGPDTIRARVWSPDGIDRVDARVDEGPWVELEPGEHQDWTAPLAGDRLAKGEHRLDVRARGRSGRAGDHRIAFAVDPTGRYTAVPDARPRVTATAFC